MILRSFWALQKVHDCHSLQHPPRGPRHRLLAAEVQYESRSNYHVLTSFESKAESGDASVPTPLSRYKPALRAIGGTLCKEALARYAGLAAAYTDVS